MRLKWADSDSALIDPNLVGVRPLGMAVVTLHSKLVSDSESESVESEEKGLTESLYDEAGESSLPRVGLRGCLIGEKLHLSTGVPDTSSGSARVVSLRRLVLWLVWGGNVISEYVEPVGYLAMKKPIPELPLSSIARPYRGGHPRDDSRPLQLHTISKFDSPTCPHCGHSLEDGYHVTFVCPRHRQQRRNLIRRITSWEELDHPIWRKKNEDEECETVEAFFAYLYRPLAGRF
ncbi:hypothetical protein EV426DRAFT_716640 [Tirmania nivea]|nr:hypothetical protein EV426DRAFT_716640 [Tirmania nivea]